jgi:cytochrome c5
MPASSSPSTSIRPAAAWAAALLLAGCAGNARIPQPTAKHVELAGRNGQVTTLDALKVGRSLYIGRCGACHSLKDPGALEPGDWPEMVQRMAENAKLNEDQQRAITQYLVGVSAALHDSASAPASPADSARAPHG